MYKSGGKTLAVSGKVLHLSSKIKRLQNQLQRIQNNSKRTLTETWMLKYFKLKVNCKVAEIIKYQPQEVSNHLLSLKNAKIKKQMTLSLSKLSSYCSLLI